MKIVFTGGGTGGHFYPIIAVAEEINNIVKEKKLLSPKLYYIGPRPYDARALYENNIIYKQSPAGKLRHYFSLLGFFDICKTGIGVIKTIFQMFFIYPSFVILSLVGMKFLISSLPTIFGDTPGKIMCYVLFAGIFVNIGTTSYFMIKYHPHQNQNL